MDWRLRYDEDTSFFNTADEGQPECRQDRSSLLIEAPAFFPVARIEHTSYHEAAPDWGSCFLSPPGNHTATLITIPDADYSYLYAKTVSWDWLGFLFGIERRAVLLSAGRVLIIRKEHAGTFNIDAMPVYRHFPWIYFSQSSVTWRILSTYMKESHFILATGFEHFDFSGVYMIARWMID